MSASFLQFHPDMVLGAAMVSGVFVFFYLSRLRRRKILSLSWPSDIGAFEFKRRVRAYLIYHGWSATKEVDSAQGFVAKRDNLEVYIFCLSKLAGISENTSQDLLDYRTVPGGWPSLCITEMPLKRVLRNLASERGVNIIPYNQLSNLVGIRQPTQENLILFCAEASAGPDRAVGEQEFYRQIFRD